MNAAGEENSKKYKGLIWLSASASAEFFADIALCPSEMVKVKVQTSPAGTWPTAFGPAASKMWAERASTRFPFGSLVPLWSRQIPYTMAKFYFFEKVRKGTSVGEWCESERASASPFELNCLLISTFLSPFIR